MAASRVFTDILALPGRRAVVLDGGFGTELERVGKDYGEDPLWSARVLADDPEAVKRVHRTYYEAGADVGTTCSYQATHKGFERAGFSSSESEELFKRSVRLAASARDEFWASASKGMKPEAPDESNGAAKQRQRRLKPLVAFSSGPFAAALADGSEYSGTYADSTTFEQFVSFHRKKLQAVEGEDFDVIAFETIAALEEARAIAHLLRTEPPGKPAWLSFNCKDEQRLAHGEDFAKEAVPLAAEVSSIVAVGVNCVPPRNVPQLMASARATLQALDDPPLLVAYPNSGEGWISDIGEWDGDSDFQGCDLGEVGRAWVDAGARVVGGCCRTTPQYVSSLAAALT